MIRSQKIGGFVIGFVYLYAIQNQRLDRIYNG